MCAKASVLVWQQKYWATCGIQFALETFTVTVWTLCSHCIICLETWNTQVDFLHVVGSADTTKNTPCPGFCSTWCMCTQWLEQNLIGLRGSIYQGTRLKYRLHMISICNHFSTASKHFLYWMQVFKAIVCFKGQCSTNSGLWDNDKCFDYINNIYIYIYISPPWGPHTPSFPQAHHLCQVNQ